MAGTPDTSVQISIRNLSRHILRCEGLLQKYDSIAGYLNWTIRNDLSRASRALMMKDAPEMNHMIAVLLGYRNGRV